MDYVNVAGEWVDMVGGIFINHPWHQAATINVEDRTFPATAHFGPKLQITDEFYENKEFSRNRVRVLMSLDTSSVDMTKPPSSARTAISPGLEFATTARAAFSAVRWDTRTRSTIGPTCRRCIWKR